MADVTLQIGGRSYSVACRAGEEDHLRALGRIVDAKATESQASVGGINEVRQLLFAALLLADELNDARHGIVPATNPNLAPALERLAERVEAMADRLEESRSNA